jgi:hypothetical protein
MVTHRGYAESCARRASPYKIRLTILSNQISGVKVKHINVFSSLKVII